MGLVFQPLSERTGSRLGLAEVSSCPSITLAYRTRIRSLVSLLSIGEGRPTGEAHEGGHLLFVHGDAESAAGRGDLEDFFLLVERALEAGDFLDPSGLLGGGDHGQTDTEHGERGDQFHRFYGLRKISGRVDEILDMGKTVL